MVVNTNHAVVSYGPGVYYDLLCFIHIYFQMMLITPLYESTPDVWLRMLESLLSRLSITVYKVKRKEELTVPWGTPVVPRVSSESTELNLTLCGLLERKEKYHLKGLTFSHISKGQRPN